MPFDGSGNFNPAASPNFPAIGGELISSAYYNNVINDLATGLSNTLTKDGQGRPATDLNWNGKSLTNANVLGAVTGTFSGNVTVGGTLAVTGAVTFSSTLAVAGAATLAALGAINGAFSGTLSVSGATTLAAVTATNGTFSGTLNVTGVTTLGVVNTGSVSASVSSGSIAPITGVSNVASLPSGSFTNNGGGSAVIGMTSSITSGGNNTNSYHFAGITQSVALWYLYGNGTTSYTSDERVKKNITTARDGYLNDLCQLRIVKYNWYTDDEGTPQEMGLIAQEVEKVFPGLVADALHPTQAGQIRKVLKGSVFTFILIKALQEANAKIEALTTRIEALEV